MPKEKIFDDAGLFDLEVGWSREGQHVQVGIVTHTGVSLADWLAGAGKDQLPNGDPPTPDKNPPFRTANKVASGDLPNFNSLWGTLDRAQINRLIRTLRKARDEAYGRDE